MCSLSAQLLTRDPLLKEGTNKRIVRRQKAGLFCSNVRWRRRSRCGRQFPATKKQTTIKSRCLRCELSMGKRQLGLARSRLRSSQYSNWESKFHLPLRSRTGPSFLQHQLAQAFSPSQRQIQTSKPLQRPKSTGPLPRLQRKGKRTSFKVTNAARKARKTVASTKVFSPRLTKNI